jgi:hypothetical protein
VVFDGGRLKLTVFPSLETILTIQGLDEHRTLVFIYEQCCPTIPLLKELGLHGPETLVKVVRGGWKGPKPLFLEEIK